MNVIAFDQSASNKLHMLINATACTFCIVITVMFWSKLEAAMVFGLALGVLGCGFAAVMLFRRRGASEGSYVITFTPKGITIAAGNKLFLPASEIVECRLEEIERKMRGDSDYSYAGHILLTSGKRIPLPIQPSDQARFRLFKNHCQLNKFPCVEEKTVA